MYKHWVIHSLTAVKKNLQHSKCYIHLTYKIQALTYFSSDICLRYLMSITLTRGRVLTQMLTLHAKLYRVSHIELLSGVEGSIIFLIHGA